MISSEQEELALEQIERALELLNQGDATALSDYLHDLHPVELASLINSVEGDVQRRLLKHIGGLDQLSELIALSNDVLRSRILDLLDDSRIAAVSRRMEVDDAVDLIGSISRRRQVRVLRRLSPERVKELTTLLAYDQDTAGGIMTTRFLAFPPDLTANDALSVLRSGLRDESIHEQTDFGYGYILDERGSLLGAVSLRELLSASPAAPLADFMERDLITVTTDTDQEDAARLLTDYDLRALPVLAEDPLVAENGDETDGRMVGVITFDDVLDVFEEEHTEDLLKLAGSKESDTVGATVFTAFRSRMPWLITSWLGGVGGAMLLASYNEALQHYVALAFFMPVVFGMGGNVGSQSSTITVHGLASGDLGQYRVMSRVQKELIVGLLLGVVFGLALASVSFALYRNYSLAVTVGASIMITMTAAATLGSILPIAFQRLGLDPAVASGPLVTTGTDILSITIYFSIATALLF